GRPVDQIGAEPAIGDVIKIKVPRWATVGEPDLEAAALRDDFVRDDANATDHSSIEARRTPARKLCCRVDPSRAPLYWLAARCSFRQNCGDFCGDLYRFRPRFVRLARRRRNRKIGLYLLIFQVFPPVGPRGGVVTQRSAKPFTPVQFWSWPPSI